MEVLILIIIAAWVTKWAVENGHLDWQSAKAANRRSTRGQPVSKRAWSAFRHDGGYWAHQLLNGFPQLRGDLAAGWHAGRQAQAEGLARRQADKADHLALRARLLPEIQDHRRRQAEALQAIRDARTPADQSGPSSQAVTGSTLVPGLDRAIEAPAAASMAQAAQQTASAPTSVSPPTPTTEGRTAMAGETSYTEQLTEMQAIQRDAEEAAAVAVRKRMTSRLDILSSMGLDAATLADAADIDDALKEFEKAAQRLIEAATAGVDGLKRRHGGIKQAVDDAPVDKPADGEFYTD